MTTEIAATARQDARNSFSSGADVADVISDFQSANADIAGYQSDEYRDVFLAEWAVIAGEMCSAATDLTAAEREEAAIYAREYLAGDYGDPADWTAASIASAEMDGDTGDRLGHTDYARAFAAEIGAAFERLRAAE